MPPEARSATFDRSTRPPSRVRSRGVVRNKVLEELAGTGGKVVKSSLSHDDEAKLQAALSAAKQ